MSKKLISLLLAVMLAVSMFIVAVVSVLATENIYMVESNIINSDVPDESIMTEQENGTYIKLFSNVPEGEYSFKIIENGVTKISDAYDNSFKFRVSSPCDVIITYNPATGKVDFLGDSVTQAGKFEIDHISVVGNGSGNWLNGLDWDFDWFKTIRYNSLEKITDDIYSITYYNVEPSDNYRFEFVVNGSWINSWGLSPEGNVPEFGKAFDIAYNGNNIILDTKQFGYVLSDVTLTVDLSDFDYSTKKGAKLTVDVVNASNPVTVGSSGQTSSSTDVSQSGNVSAPSNSGEALSSTAPSSSVLGTAASSGEATEPSADVLNLTVNATSNYFPETSARYNPNTNEVTVTFGIKASKNMLDTQWYLTYDTEILEFSDKNTLESLCPVIGESGSSLTLEENEDGVGFVRYSASDIRLFDISSDMTTFASIVFKVKDISKRAPVSTTVDLVVSVLRVADLAENGIVSEAGTEVLIIGNEVVRNSTPSVRTQLKTTLTPATYVELTTVAPSTEGTSASGVQGVTEAGEGQTTGSSSGANVAPTSTQSSENTEPNKSDSNTAYNQDSAQSTADTPSSESSTTAIIQTGSASSAAIILILLISATVIMFVLLKREMY